MSIKDLQTEQQPIEVKQLQARFLQIEQALVEATPELPHALAEIHKQLLQHEEFIHLLDDTDIAHYHQAFEQFKQHHLIQKTVKIGKKTKKVSDQDLLRL